MVISGITYFPYQLTLKKPFVNSKNIITTRSGYIIEIADNLGNVGIGEAAHLPEFGSETPERSLAGILKFISEYPDEINDIKDIIFSVQNYNDFPAAKHGIEQALLNLFSAVSDKSLPELLNMDSNPDIKVNSLIGMVQPEEAANSAARMVDEGYDTIKIKVGRKDFQEDLEVVSGVRKAAGEEINLRIDVNGKWSFEEAIRNIKKLEKFDPEYIEQPVLKKEDLINVASFSEVQIAADESLRSITDVCEFIDNKSCGVLILKPMMLGGIIELVDVIRKASEMNIKTIISSSFESAVGFRTNLLLASFIKDKYAHGLSTIDHFETDIYNNPFHIEKGKIKITDDFIFSRI